MRSRRPPIRQLIQIRKSRVAVLFAGEHQPDFLQPIQRFVMQRILQKYLRLHDQVFQRLRLAASLIGHALDYHFVGRRMLERTWRTCAGTGRSREPAGDRLKIVSSILPANHSTAPGCDSRRSRCPPVFERFGRFGMLPSFQILIEELDQNFEVLRFLVELVVKGRPQLQYACDCGNFSPS